MSNESGGHDAGLAFLWGLLFASGKKKSGDPNDMGLGCLAFILLVLAIIPFAPLIILGVGLVNLSPELGVHPVILGLSACVWSYWAFAFAGSIYRYLPVAVSASLTAVCLTVAYLIAGLLFFTLGSGPIPNGAKEVLHGNFTHVNWILAAVVVVPMLIGSYYIGKRLALWIKESRKHSARVRLVVLAVSIIFAVIDFTPALSWVGLSSNIRQIGGEGAVVVVADVPFNASRFTQRSEWKHYEGTFHAGERLCATYVSLGDGGRIKFRLKDGYEAMAENDRKYFQPDTSPRDCGGIATTYLCVRCRRHSQTPP